jgi:hypothetical protein
MDKLLYKVRVASPCSADWQQMVGNDTVRHCSQCNLNVYNLSAMTGIEAQDLVAKHEGRMCVRFYHRKDGTVLTQNCPVGLKVVMQRVSRVAGIALSAVMSATPLTAQTESRTQAQVMESEASLDLIVVDLQGAVCHGANVQLVGENYKIDQVTNDEGALHLSHILPGTYVVNVTYPGFGGYKRTVSLPARKNAVLKVVLQVAALQGMIAEANIVEIPTIDSPPVVLDFVPLPPSKPVVQRHGFLRRIFSKLF